ncbi:MAG: hypothetical protein J3Q66DRAFT_352867 [Benniella sp.]|nr:MAG: hypothetical protein J3Q66DRAFT_352867 [Benniella sp.]
MRRHTDVPYYFRHKAERVKFRRTGKEGDEERPYLCACQQIFHEQNLLAEHLFGTCRVYGTPPTVGQMSQQAGTMIDQPHSHPHQFQQPQPMQYVPEGPLMDAPHPPPYSQTPPSKAELEAITDTATIASLSQPQILSSQPVASPYCPTNFQEVLFTKLDQIGEQVAHLNQKLIPRESYPHIHPSPSLHPGQGGVVPPHLSPLPSPSPSPSGDNRHHGERSHSNSNVNSNVNSNTNSKQGSARTSRSNSHSSGHSASGVGGSLYDDMSNMNQSINRIETSVGTLGTCFAHILEKLDRVEQRHQEFQSSARVVNQFTELISGFSSTIQAEASGSSTKPSKKHGWRSQSNRHPNTCPETPSVPEHQGPPAQSPQKSRR